LIGDTTPAAGGGLILCFIMGAQKIMKYILALSIMMYSLLGNVCLQAQIRSGEGTWKGLNSSLKKDVFYPKRPAKFRSIEKAIAAPLILTAVGLFSQTDNDLLSRYEIQEERNEWAPNFHHNADDYIQYVPIVAVYGLNALGVTGKNDFANRTAILIKSEIIMAAMTFSLKKITAVPRPDTGEPTSFPSGHTAQVFAAATFMAKEYGSRSVWYSIGAYSVATGIGVMRVLNNRHWVSDVLVGAGIGIFSTNLVYLTHRYKWGKGRDNKSTMILPSYDGQTGMVTIIQHL
jgi:membrane-associated phospholipid phosphatase